MLRHDGLDAPTLTLLQTAGEPVLALLSEDGLPARFNARWEAGGPARPLSFVYDERQHFQYVAEGLDRTALGELATGSQLRLATQVVGNIDYDLRAAATSVTAFLECVRALPEPPPSEPQVSENTAPDEELAEDSAPEEDIAEAPPQDDLPEETLPPEELAEEPLPEEEVVEETAPEEPAEEDVAPADVTVEDVRPDEEGTAAAAVRGFYSALERGDGREAAGFVVPEKRGRGPYSAEGMSRFYGNLSQPLELLSVRALDERRFLARYTFESAGSVCDGRARVTTVERDGRYFVQSINALSGC